MSSITQTPQKKGRFSCLSSSFINNNNNNNNNNNRFYSNDIEYNKDRRLINKDILNNINIKTNISQTQNQQQNRFDRLIGNYKILYINNNTIIKFKLPISGNIKYKLQEAFDEQISIKTTFYKHKYNKLLSNKLFIQDKTYNETNLNIWLNSRKNNLAIKSHYYYINYFKYKDKDKKKSKYFIEMALDARIKDMIIHQTINKIYFDKKTNISVYEIYKLQKNCFSHLYAVLVLYNEYLFIKKKYII